MKKILLIFIGVLTIIDSYSQPVNCNPDPDGPLWLAGGLNDFYSPHEQDIIDAMNQIELNSTLDLPDIVDNSLSDYLPIVYNQSLNICAQAALVYNMFTYEINCARGTSATSGNSNINSKVFSPSFVYNFLNSGLDNGSSVIIGMEILKESGCPDIGTYGDATGSYSIENDDITEWMSGYSEYETALSKRVTYVEKVDLESNDDLTALKHWLDNHNCNDETKDGGLATIVFAHMFSIQPLDVTDPDYPDTKYIFYANETAANDAHAMTIVGYDDNIQCGSNTGIGALKLLNTWGEDYGGANGNGCIYLPYSAISKPHMLVRDNSLDAIIWSFILHVDTNYNTDIILKQELMCNDRYYISHCVGGHYILGSTIPYSNYKYEYTTYGPSGHIPLLGNDFTNVHMEYSLDYQYFIDTLSIDRDNIKTFHYGILHNSFINPEPTTLYYLSLVDNRCPTPIEIIEVSSPTIVDMTNLNNGNYCWLGIDYNRLNETYSSNEIINSETYSHCLTTIESGVTVEFSNNSEILFYDGIVDIQPGATLDLKDCYIRLVQGVNKIVVRGNLLFSGNPIFESEGGILEIEYHNETFPPISYEIRNASFEFNSLNKLKITGHEEPSLIINECNIEHAEIDFSGDLTIQNLIEGSKGILIDFSFGDLIIQNNSSLENTYILTSFPDEVNNNITIHSNSFINTEETIQKSVISVDDYRIFSIENNEIEINHCNGIELYHAGNNAGANKIVSFNEIYSTNNSNECRAIDIFFSRAEISNNNIYDNNYGVVAFGSSETTIMGNKDANSISETQQFVDNTIHCYFSYSSYPEDIRYNYFEHNATIDDPYVKLVYYDIIEPEPPAVDGSVIYNIECNAWYSTFNPEEDLVPNGSYDYDPYWTIGQYCVKDGGEAGALYDEAKEYVDSGYYSQADSNFKEIISDFPDDPHAIQSLRELYNIEESNGNDYDSLRLYYKTVITANQDSLLCRSANWMSMHCLIMMDSSQKAIDWLDSTINVPQNTVDSIFAIINLGYIYTHFPDTTLKSTLYTTHNEYIPKSYADYKNKREELFETLLKSSSNENETEDLTVDKNATIMQLSPNPTKEAINAKIEVETEGYLKIELFSSLGAKIGEIDLGKVHAGIIERNISLTNQPQGMYYVMIKHNNVVQETKKMIKL